MDLVLPQPTDEDTAIISFFKNQSELTPKLHSLEIVKMLILVIIVVLSPDLLGICKVMESHAI